jgi:hypothetical protein
MQPNHREPLGARVIAAATRAMQRQGHVAAIDVMVELGWLPPSHVLEWRTRRIPFLCAAIQTRPDKVAAALRALAAWAERQGMHGAPGEYVARTAAREPLQFTASNAPDAEAAWSTHWTPAALSAAQRAKAEAKATKPPELVAIEPRDPDWKCHRCGGGEGSFLVRSPRARRACAVPASAISSSCPQATRCCHAARAPRAS